MSLFNDMYDGIVNGMKEPEKKETTEGKVPAETDKEDTKIQKLTEDENQEWTGEIHQDDEELVSYKCKECGFEASTREEMRKHMIKMHGKVIFDSIEEEKKVEAGDRVTSGDGTKKGAVIALAKDNPSIGIVKWDDAEAEMPVPLVNLKVEEKKIKEDFAEEHGLGKADKEAEPEKKPEHEIENTAGVETPKEETPTITKEYVGKSEDTHFYLISKDAATGEREDLQIVDQEGIMKFSAKANNLDMNKADDFIISAIKDVEIDQIERSIFVKYLLPRLEKEDVAEEPEIEKEEGVEELKPKAKKEPEEKAEATESKKVNEATKSFEISFRDLDKDAQKRYLEFAGLENSEEVDIAPLAIVDIEVEECKATEVKEDTAKRDIKIGDEIIWDIWPGKVVGEGSDQGKPVWKVMLHGKQRSMPFDIPKGDDELRLAEGKVPAESDKEDTKIKKLIETKITDEEGNEFEVSLVDDGTEDTVIDINGREFRFSDDFAGLWKDETGCLTDEGLKELALDALANLEDDVYNELVGVGKAQVAAEKESDEEGGVVGEDKTAEVKVDESYGNVSIKADIESGLSKEEIIKKIQDRYPDIKIEQAEEIYNGVKNGTAIDWTHKTTKVKENKQLKEAELTDEKCPDCGKFLTKYVGQKTGRITLKCSNCGNELHPEEKVEEPKKETTEGKVPDPKDDETTTNKKLTEATVDCPVCGGALEVLDDNARQERERITYYCPKCDKDYSRLITFQLQSSMVASDEWENLEESKKDLLSELLDLDKD